MAVLVFVNMEGYMQTVFLFMVSFLFQTFAFMQLLFSQRHRNRQQQTKILNYRRTNVVASIRRQRCYMQLKKTVMLHIWLHRGLCDGHRQFCEYLGKSSGKVFWTTSMKRCGCNTFACREIRLSVCCSLWDPLWNERQPAGENRWNPDWESLLCCGGTLPQVNTGPYPVCLALEYQQSACLFIR